MVIADLNVLKARFANGEKPTAADMVDLIDTLAAVAAGTVQTAGLADGAVTLAKIAPYSGSGAKLLQSDTNVLSWV